VFVVARNRDQVIYYEDVEDGFNVSLISPEGWILEPAIRIVWGLRSTLGKKARKAASFRLMSARLRNE
jgi:hypothetical protein